MRTICFLKSRRGVELIQKFARLRLEDAGRADLADRIAPYRAGYTAAQRRELERRLAEGELLAVVATDALELGIDVGDLDAAVCVTFPGTVASLRQMWGRAGRKDTGLALYVAGDDALDQFFCRHPEEFLDRPVESAILDHESEEVHLAHLLAAAYELPLSPDDAETLGPRWEAHAERLVKLGELRERGGRYLLRGSDYPAARIPLRSASADAVAIVEAGGGEVIGTVETARAHSAVHPGAIYLHMGSSYEVEELDLPGRRALVRAFAGDWYTQPKKETDTSIERVLDTREVGGVALSFGTVSVTEQVIAYQRKRVSDHEVLDFATVDLPEQQFATQALWYELPDAFLGHDFPLDVLQGSLHAAEHSQIAVLPLIAMCDRWDIGGLSTAVHHQTGRPTIFIYDGHPGGVGITRLGFRQLRGAGGGRPAPDLGVPVRRRLPVVRAVAQVRQPQRAAQQERRARAARADGGGLKDPLQRGGVRAPSSSRGFRLRQEPGWPAPSHSSSPPCIAAAPATAAADSGGAAAPPPGSGPPSRRPGPATPT